MRLVVLNALLLVALMAAAVLLEVVERPAAAVEASVRRYAAAVSAGDLQAALAEIAPDQRQRWSSWVAGQLGNVYEVRGIAVRTPSPLERLLHRTGGAPSEVTVVLDVDRDYPDEFYEPTTRVPLAQVDGRPYLAAPLIEPEAANG